MHKKCSGVKRLTEDPDYRCSQCQGTARPLDSRPLREVQVGLDKLEVKNTWPEREKKIVCIFKNPNLGDKWIPFLSQYTSNVPCLVQRKKASKLPVLFEQLYRIKQQYCSSLKTIRLKGKFRAVTIGDSMLHLSHKNTFKKL